MATTKARPQKKSKRLSLIEQMERAGPSRAQLRKLAKTHKPPQSWYDQTDNPLKPKSK